MRLIAITLLALAASLQAQTSFSNADTARTLPPVTVEKPAPRAVAVAAPPRAQAVAPTADGPRGSVVLRAGDSFQLIMSGMPVEDSAAFPREYTVGQDGTVNITYAGQIRAAGLSQSQLERMIEQRLISEKIFRNPTATINVQAGARAVTVGGNVRAPNRLAWSSDLTLLTAIMACGGPSDFAGRKVNLIRGSEIMTVDYNKLRKNPADDVKLLPGDKIDYL